MGHVELLLPVLPQINAVLKTTLNIMVGYHLKNYSLVIRMMVRTMVGMHLTIALLCEI